MRCPYCGLVVGELTKQHLKKHNIDDKEFYKQHPEFKVNKFTIVKSVRNQPSPTARKVV